ncbi:SLC13 family permease [Undibacterium arcticum]
MNHPSPVSPLQALRKDWFFFWTLLLLLVGLTAVAPAKVSGYPALVDWPTIATLAGLLVLTKGVELSGYLHHLGERLLVLMPTERALALFLVLATALLSMLLTNDVALFVVVPLTVSLRIAVAAPLPITRLIIFEALAANAGSALTPIGNPQNLFLWQQSQLPFHSFVVALLPLFLLLMVPLLVLSAAAFFQSCAADPPVGRAAAGTPPPAMAVAGAVSAVPDPDRTASCAGGVAGAAGDLPAWFSQGIGAR